MIDEIIDEDKIVNSEKVLILDGNNLAMRTVFSILFRNPEDQDEGYKLWKHLFINNIFSLIQKFKPKRLILAFDTSNSWRYNIYPNYKLNRKAAFVIVNIPDSDYSRGPKGIGYSIYADLIYHQYKIAEDNKQIIENYGYVMNYYKNEYDKKCAEELKRFIIASEQYNNAIKELDKN
jgi:5'-3' exonuclease